MANNKDIIVNDVNYTKKFETKSTGKHNENALCTLKTIAFICIIDGNISKVFFPVQNIAFPSIILFLVC